MGQAKITKGYGLRARFVIHTVGPVWRGGSFGERELLASCYRNSLAIAAERGLGTIAFPSISTGAYRYPMERAVGVAVETVREVLSASSTPMEVTFCCSSSGDLELYTALLARP